MTSLAKGANAPLGVVPPGTAVAVRVGWTAPGPGHDLDLLAIPVDAAGRCTGVGDIAFFNRRQGLGGALELVADDRGSTGSDSETVLVRTEALPGAVTRIVFAVLIHDAGARSQAFADLSAAHIAVGLQGAPDDVCRFDLTERGSEQVMVLGELYLHTSGWKFRAVGQGYAGGLAGLAEQLAFAPAALDLAKAPTAPSAPTPPAAAPAAPAAAPTRVVLTKAAPTVSLTKRDRPSGILRINLNWTPRPAPQEQAARPTGLLGRLQGAASPSIDLDLACLYELADGTLGVIQALGNAFQVPRTGAPLIRLDGDDRSGTQDAGENLFIDLARSAEIKRVLVFAFIYQGVPNWAGANAVVTMHPTDGPPVVVALDEPDPASPTCAIAMIENVGGEVQVRREVRYVQGKQDVLDQAYGWGLRWTAGRK